MAYKKSPVEALAISLGYKSVKDMRAQLGSDSDKKGKKIKEKGSLRARLESGQGIGESIKGAFTDKTTSIKETFTKEGMKKFAKKKGKEAYMNFFSGDNLFDTYMRGRMTNRGEEKAKLQPIESPEEGEDAGGLGGGEANVYLKIIAKNSTSLHLMARDVNVFRQNIIKLTKMEHKKATEQKKGDKKKTKKEQAKDDSLEATNKADTFFMREDEREAKLESERAKFSKKPESKSPTPEKKEDGGGFLNSIMSMLVNGLMGGLKFLLNPGAILKLIGKVFVIGALLISLFQGITAAFDKWKETGSIKEAIIAGLGAIIDFLTFGLFGEDSVKKIFKAVEDFIDPIVNSVKDVILSIKDWVANNVGIPEISIPVPKVLQKLGAPEKISIGPWYPFKDDPSSAAPQVSKKSSPAEQKTPETIANEVKMPGARKSELSERDKVENELGVVRDASTGIPSYKGIKFFDPVDSNELKDVVRAIDDGKEGYEYKTIDPVTGKENKRKLSLKPTPTKASSAPTTEAPTPTPVMSGGASGGAAAPSASSGASGGSVPTETPSSPQESGGGAAASPEATAQAPAVSGDALSKESSDVAEKQRMESAADVGSTVNAPVTNNSQNKEMGGVKPKASNVFDSDFLTAYMAT
jgi:ribosomal protein L14E/L6E/L27E